MTTALLPLLVLACAPDAGPRRADPSRDSGATDSGDTDTDPPVPTVSVGHDRELRGLYVATVYAIDWPTRTSDSAAAQQADIDALLDLAAASGMNAVFVQMRTEGDALYASDLEPWSRWLTGTQGQDPGYDPLARWVSGAHARGLELHVWLNPYRAKVGSESTSGLADGHMALAFPEHAHAYGGDVWMDPAAPEVRQRVLDVIGDLLSRYDLDGVHFDDYFYPYPDDGEFPDDATYDAYVAGGGSLARDDWRRANTALLVEEVSDAIRAVDSAVRFGIAPFGIWRPGYPDGISGFDAYEGLYADPLAWAESGTVDYLAPQLYWETTNDGQEYGLLTPWWNDAIPDGVWLFPANALYQLGSGSTWTLDELAAQLEVCRDPALTRTAGNLWYNASPLIDDTDGVRDAFATRYYSTPALPPPVNALAGTIEDPPELTLEGATVRWSSRPGRRAVTVYAADGDGWTLARIVPAEQGEVTLTTGRWALASVSVGDVESGGVVVEVP